MKPDVINEIVDWMYAGSGLSADPEDFLSTLADRLNDAGADIDRFAVFMQTLHPHLRARRFVWTRDSGIEMRITDFAIFDTPDYLQSPMPIVVKTKENVRCLLIDPTCPHDFGILTELREEGYTDYLMQPLILTDGNALAVSWTTRAEGGFSDEILEMLERLRGPLSKLVEIYLLRVNASNLLSTYVGRNSGERILAGKIGRGDLEQIEAAIVFVDLKDYTRISEGLPADSVIAFLNRFFDAVVPPIEAEGGEVLKFLGDGALAIFVEDRNQLKSGLVRAVRSLATGRDAMREAGEDFIAICGEKAEFRAALHEGEIIYGNVGSEDRLDFTVVGSAVNHTARLLSVAAETSFDHVCSSEVAGALGPLARPLGTFALKGLPGEHAVYALQTEGLVLSNQNATARA